MLNELGDNVGNYRREFLLMKKEFSFTQTYDAPFERVWEILCDPSEIVMEHNAHYDKISNTNWIDHTGQNVDNTFNADIDEASHTITIEAINSKYASERNVIVLNAKESDGQTIVSVDYTIGTTAIFNIITMELLGEKIIHHASNVILKHINKKLK